MDRQTAVNAALAQIERNFGTPKNSALKQHVATFTSENEKVALYFGKGSFDNWCIHVISGNKRWMRFPTDVWYFRIVRQWSKERSAKAIYDDFVRIYDATTAGAKYDDTAPVIQLIKEISWNHRDDFEACVVWTILYMGMIAEENKDGAILKKRIKRLGMHQVLIDNIPPTAAANFSRGKAVGDLTLECHRRGF